MTKKLVGVTLASLEDGADVALADRHKTIWHDEDTVLAGDATIRKNVQALQTYCVYVDRASMADGDSAGQEIVLAPGTYSFFVLGFTGGSQGKLDWYLDAAKIVDGQDWYSGGGTWNVIKSTTSIVVAGGRYTLKFIANGKNGSSANYWHALTKSWFVRTGA